MKIETSAPNLTNANTWKLDCSGMSVMGEEGIWPSYSWFRPQQDYSNSSRQGSDPAGTVPSAVFWLSLFRAARSDVDDPVHVYESQFGTFLQFSGLLVAPKSCLVDCFGSNLSSDLECSRLRDYLWTDMNQSFPKQIVNVIILLWGVNNGLAFRVALDI